MVLKTITSINILTFLRMLECWFHKNKNPSVGCLKKIQGVRNSYSERQLDWLACGDLNPGPLIGGPGALRLSYRPSTILHLLYSLLFGNQEPYTKTELEILFFEIVSES